MSNDPVRDGLEQTVAKLYQEQGRFIARDPVRVRTLLQQVYPGTDLDQWADGSAAIGAVEYDVFDLLGTSTDQAAVDGFVAQMVAGGYSDDEARWAVQAWARAAGLPLVAGLAAGGVAAAPPAAAAPPPGSPPPTGAAPPPSYPPPAASPPPTQPTPVTAAQPAAFAGYGASGPPGGGGYSPPPGAAGYGAPPPTKTGSKTGLFVALGALVVLLLVAGVVIALTRGGGEPVAGTTTTSGVTDTTKKPAKKTTTTTEEETSTTRRSTTTTERTTTTTEQTTTTEAPLQFKTFNDPAGRYSIDFPGDPGLQTSTTNIDGNSVGIFSYSTVAKGVTYELVILELPQGYYFTDPRGFLERVMGSIISSAGGSITVRDPSDFAGNPALFIATKGPTSETNVFGLIAGNRVYLMDVQGKPDLSNADFPTFRNSFKIR